MWSCRLEGIQFNPFPMTAPQTTINTEGKLELRFSAPDNAAFFRGIARAWVYAEMKARPKK